MSNNVIPLSHLSVGSSAMIIRSEVPPELRQRLTELGFTPNAAVSIVFNSGKRLICKLQSARIGIDQSLADNIMVTPLSE
ncbi:MAG TPA: FeoA family protein [Bacteroidota bacterium]|nr:FeoA family protein [Bacteroidota bacterium]